MTAPLQFNNADISELLRHAVDPDLARRISVRPMRNRRGLERPWPDADGETYMYPRIHTDLRRKGEKTKYAADRTPGLALCRAGTDQHKVIIAEGWMQSLAVATWAPPEFFVFAMNGCDGVNKGNVHTLGWVDEREVWLIFDADRRSNPKVAAAVNRVVGHLESAGASRVHVVDVPGMRNDGIDDVLAWWPTDQRQERMAALLADAETTASSARRLVLTPASQIKMRASRWLWAEPAGPTLLDAVFDAKHWLPLGGLTLLGGREGTGKSTWAYELAARVTRGTLPGCYEGEPRGVIVCATEDSWEHTVKPRLAAADADLARVWRAEVHEADVTTGLTLPIDVAALRRSCEEHDAALVLLDPLMGAIDSELDSHKDHEVRIALEPVSRLADDAQVAIIALIHVNKGASGDLLNRIMGSRAFSAVARSVLMTYRELAEGPEAPEVYLFGQAKNNLAAKVRETKRYDFESVLVGRDDDIGADIWSSRVRLLGTRPERIEDIVLEQENRKPQRETIADRCEQWMRQFMAGKGELPSAEVKAAGKQEGFKMNALQRARAELEYGGELKVVSVEGSTETTWLLVEPVQSSAAGSRTVTEDGSSGEKGSNESNEANTSNEANEAKEPSYFSLRANGDGQTVKSQDGAYPFVRSFDSFDSPPPSNEGGSPRNVTSSPVDGPPVYRWGDCPRCEQLRHSDPSDPDHSCKVCATPLVHPPRRTTPPDERRDDLGPCVECGETIPWGLGIRATFKRGDGPRRYRHRILRQCPAFQRGDVS